MLKTVPLKLDARAPLDQVVKRTTSLIFTTVKHHTVEKNLTIDIWAYIYVDLC